MSFDPTKYANKSKTGRRIVAGEVYLLSDECIEFPARRGREFHATDRRVVVLQDETATAYENLKTVLVAPCSARWSAGPFDHDFGEEIPTGFTTAPTVFVSLTQPVLKTDLGKREGTMTPEELEPLVSKLGQLLGWASPLKI